MILCRAIMSKDYNLVKSCFSHGAKMDDWVHCAAGRALTIELLDILIPAGFDVNYKEDRYGGYVTCTASCVDMEFTKYLLDRGADPNINPTVDLYPALNKAVQYNNSEMVELLIHYGAKVNGLGALGTAATYQRFEMMELLLKHGADVNDTATDRINESVDWFGMTALHQAAQAGHLDVVTFLIEHGARTDLKDEEGGRTPLMFAQENGHQEVVEFLSKI